MSRIVITTCTYYQPKKFGVNRITNFFNSIHNAVLLLPEYRDYLHLLMVVMGMPFPDELLLSVRERIPNVEIVYSGVEERKAARVAAMIRQRHIEKHLEDDDILCAFDDDYIFNPYAFKFIKTIFDENEDMNFISVLKPWESVKYVDKNNLVVKSKFLWWVTGSCMGGCSCYRWREFRKYIYEYFNEYKVSTESDNKLAHGSFDQTFFGFVGEKVGKPYIYHLMDFSLCQHTWHKSHWYEMRGSRPLHHTWGDKFDPFFDPFLIRELLEKSHERD